MFLFVLFNNQTSAKSVIIIKENKRSENGIISQSFRDRKLNFCETMKYFRYILMGREIFFKIFDGLQNIFLSSIFIILFFKLKGLRHKICELAVKDI